MEVLAHEVRGVRRLLEPAEGHDIRSSVERQALSDLGEHFLVVGERAAARRLRVYFNHERAVLICAFDGL